MSSIAIDYPDEVIHWFRDRLGQEHARRMTVGPCPHNCGHRSTTVVAWGPDERHYELVACDDDPGCAGNCQGWMPAEGAYRSEARHRIDWRLLS
jgi:hypothetical protein